MNRIQKIIPLLVIASLAIVAWQLGVTDFLSLQALKANQHQLNNFVENRPIISALIFSSLYILIVSLSLPVATLLTFTSGYLFGQLLGFVIVIISATIGSYIIFSSAKYASRSVSKKQFQDKNWFTKMKAGFHKDAFFYMLSLRLIPVFPFSLINLGAGILQVKNSIFILGTFIGIMPASFIYVSTGTILQKILDSDNPSLYSLMEPKIIFLLCGLGLLSITPILYKKFK